MRQAIRILAVGAAIISLAGCGSGTERQVVSNEPEIVVRSPEQDQLHQLDEMGRNIGLKRAITASGLRCKRVTRSGYVTEYKKLSMWTASCEDKRDWAIFVGPDGSAQVRPCGDMQQFNLPECRIAANPAGTPPRRS
ncbi:hypothetical protein ACFQPG_01260 [Sphingomonas sp. GCM10030256]|uniref:hypothetical protein n=1 Tax=Sphingomonas sp. GCM10030256 TaxID=3273427 RepID=UPI00361E54EB